MASTKVVFFLKRKGLYPNLLLKPLTGCYAYHCGFLSKEDEYVYDMHFMRRRVPWSEIVNSRPKTIFEIYDAPTEVPVSYLKERILNDNTVYGFRDYAMFGLRWLYHLFGKSTPNHDGLICSEQVYMDLGLNGWTQEFEEVPSPCALRSVLRELGLFEEVTFGAGVFKDRYDPVSRKIPVDLRVSKMEGEEEI